MATTVFQAKQLLLEEYPQVCLHFSIKNQIWSKNRQRKERNLRYNQILYFIGIIEEIMNQKNNGGFWYENTQPSKQ